MKKLFYTLLGVTLAFAGTVYAVQISVPSSIGSGFLLQSLTNGTYSPVSLTAGTNVTISTTTSNITISATGGGSGGYDFPTVASWGNSTSTTLGFFGGFLSTASSTISSALRLSSLGQGFLFTGSNGLVQPIASSSIRLSWFNNDAGFLTSAVTAVTGSYPIVSSGGNTPNLTFNGLATTSTWTAGFIPFVVNGNTIASRATTSVTCSGTVTCTSFDVLGSAPITINGSSGTSASSTLLSDTNYWSGRNTFTSATSTNFGISNLYAIGSGGIDFHSNNGTPIADFGGGGGSNATFLGGVNIDGATRLATSLTGLLKATAGAVTTASNGTDYTLITGTTCSGTDKVSAISASGAITCSADQTGGGSGGYGFITDSYAGSTVQSTTTPLWLKALTPYSLIASSTLFTYASTSNLTVSENASTTNLTVSELGNPFYNTGADKFLTVDNAGKLVLHQNDIQISEAYSFRMGEMGFESGGNGSNILRIDNQNPSHTMTVALDTSLVTPSTVPLVQFYDGSGVLCLFGINCAATTTDNIWAGLQTFNNSSTTRASFNYASSTSWFGGGLTSCSNGTTDKLLYNSSTGTFSCGTDQTGGGSAAPAFTPTAYGASTSTTLGLLGGFFSTASSTLSGNTFFPALSQGIAYIGSNGKLGATATSSFSLSQFTNDLANLTAGDSSLTFSGSYNGSAARNIVLNMGNANTWTALQTFGNSTTTYGSFTNASTTNLFLGTGQGALYTGSGARVAVVATSTPTVTAPITYSGTLGSFLGGVAGTFGCTTASSGVTGCLSGTDWNTFNGKESVLTFNYPLSRSANTISYNGLGTTTTWSAGQVPYIVNGNTLTGLSTSTPTIGSSLSYTGTMGNVLGGSSGTLSLNLGNANTWTALQTFGNSSTTLGSFSYASSTLWQGGGLQTCDPTTGKLTWSAGQFGCGTDQSGGAGSSAYEIATTSNIALSQLAYISNVSGRTTLASVATTTLSTGNGLTVSGGTLGYQVGGSNATIALNSTGLSTNALTTWNGTNLVATGTPQLTLGYILGTSTATSTLAGRLSIGTTTSLSQGSATFTVKGLMDKVAQFFTSTGTKIMEIADSGIVTLLGAWDFGGATSIEIPNGTAPTVDATGEIAVDTTSDQFIYFGGSAKQVISPTRDLGFSYATSSWNGTTTLRVGPSPAAITVNSAYCETSTGTVGVSLYDGTNRADYIPTASTTINNFKFTTNNTFTAGETIRVDVGTPASSPVNLSCRFLYTYNAD